MKNAGLARVLSVLFPGLGHVYLGDWIRGIALMILWVWLAFFIALPKLIAYSAGLLDFSRIGTSLIFPAAIFIISVMGVAGDLKAIESKQTNNESLR